jgi:hypothetical protein
MTLAVRGSPSCWIWYPKGSKKQREEYGKEEANQHAKVDTHHLVGNTETMSAPKLVATRYQESKWQGKDTHEGHDGERVLVELRFT